MAKKRAREWGLPFPGRPGPLNGITDVPGVEVGVKTLISGEGPLVVGKGPVRTGVTAILPRGRAGAHIPCAAGSYALNGNGEMTGLAWIEEAGELQTPITITNTHSCGVARDATIEWMVKRRIGTGQDWGLPVAAETYDGDLNDINGFHVKAEDVMQALDGASGGPVPLGSQGGGTGMTCYDFKGGNGSSSRLAEIGGERFAVGVFVQANFGLREELTVLGVPVGRDIRGDELRGKPAGSIIAIVATDAPLLPHQLKRLARRVPMGIARTGGIGHNSSGDIFLAFSTANSEAYAGTGAIRSAAFIAGGAIDALFQATVEATEEAIIDAIVSNETMIGRDGNTNIALPVPRMLEIMERAGRLSYTSG
jgi:D-aminopeptidase